MDQHKASLMGSPDVLRYGLLAKRLSRRSLRVQDGITSSLRPATTLTPTSAASAAEQRESITSIGSVHSETDETTPLNTKKTMTTSIREESENLTEGEVLKEIILGKFVSYFLLLAPFAILSHVNQWDPAYIFWLNFLTMV